MKHAQFSVSGDDFTDLIHVNGSDISQNLHVLDMLGDHGDANMSEAGNCIFLFKIDDLALILGLAFGFRLRRLFERINSGRLGAIGTKVARRGGSWLCVLCLHRRECNKRDP